MLHLFVLTRTIPICLEEQAEMKFLMLHGLVLLLVEGCRPFPEDVALMWSLCNLVVALMRYAASVILNHATCNDMALSTCLRSV